MSEPFFENEQYDNVGKNIHQSENINMKAPDHLEAGAVTYRERNAEYGNSYHQFGEVMGALFPGKLVLEYTEDWNRLGVLTQIIHKLCRYSNDFNKPHEDSIHDIMVYAAMLAELDQKYKEQE